MRTLRVVAHLAGPLAGDSPPMLDSLLEWCMSRHVGRKLGLTHDAGEERQAYTPGLIPIPIARRRVPGFPWSVPLASSPVLPAEAVDGVAHFARRFDVSADLIRPDDRRVFQASGGEFKGYRLPLRTRVAGRVAWLCVGDAKEVRRLLRDVTHLGKKTSQGFAPVARWDVGPWDAPEDACWFARAVAGDVLMRPLPHAAVGGRTLVGARPWFGGVVPPYWSSEHFAEGVLPC